MDYTVRRIRAHEAESLRAIRLLALADARSVFASTFEAEAAHPERLWKERAERRSAGGAEATFLAECGGGLVGMVGMFLDGDRGTAQLVSMWTSPDGRRKGVARALVEAAVEWAAGAGAAEVGLWVREDNHAAATLYRSAGFLPTGEVRPLPSDPHRTERRMSRSVARRGA